MENVAQAKNNVYSPRNPQNVTAQPPTAPDLENETSKAAAPEALPVMQRWRRVDLMEKVTLVLRSLGCAFSCLAFVVMASNKHGDWMEFDNYQEFKYVVGISVLGFLYSAVQVIRQSVQMAGRGNNLWSERTSAIVNFAGDQVIAYLLISAISSAIPMTNRMRREQENIFTSSVSASLSMAFFAFLAFAISSVTSGYKLSTQSFI